MPTSRHRLAIPGQLHTPPDACAARLLNLSPLLIRRNSPHLLQHGKSIQTEWSISSWSACVESAGKTSLGPHTLLFCPIFNTQGLDASLTQSVRWTSCNSRPTSSSIHRPRTDRLCSIQSAPSLSFRNQCSSGPTFAVLSHCWLSSRLASHVLP